MVEMKQGFCSSWSHLSTLPPTFTVFYPRGGGRSPGCRHSRLLEVSLVHSGDPAQRYPCSIFASGLLWEPLKTQHKGLDGAPKAPHLLGGQATFFGVPTLLT